MGLARVPRPSYLANQSKWGRIGNWGLVRMERLSIVNGKGSDNERSIQTGLTVFIMQYKILISIEVIISVHII